MMNLAFHIGDQMHLVGGRKGQFAPVTVDLVEASGSLDKIVLFGDKHHFERLRDAIDDAITAFNDPETTTDDWRTRDASA